MKTQNKILNSSLIALVLSTSMAHAGEASRHSGQSLEQSTQAVGHLSVGTVKAASGIVAIPFGVAGKAGEFSSQASEGLLDFANEPLEIGDEIISVGPTPAQKLQRDQGI